MSDDNLRDTERSTISVDAPQYLLDAKLPGEAARRLKTFTHHHTVLLDPRPGFVRGCVVNLARASAALPDDSDLADWRRFFTRNVHRLQRGGVQALVQMALDEGPASAPGRAVPRWLAKGAYTGTWFRDVSAVETTVDGCTLVLEGHADAVFGVVWLPGGGRVLTGGADGTLGLWNAETGLRDLTIATEAPELT